MTDMTRHIERVREMARAFAREIEADPATLTGEGAPSSADAWRERECAILVVANDASGPIYHPRATIHRADA